MALPFPSVLTFGATLLPARRCGIGWRIVFCLQPRSSSDRLIAKPSALAPQSSSQLQAGTTWMVPTAVSIVSVSFNVMIYDSFTSYNGMAASRARTSRRRVLASAKLHDTSTSCHASCSSASPTTKSTSCLDEPFSNDKRAMPPPNRVRLASKLVEHRRFKLLPFVARRGGRERREHGRINRVHFRARTRVFGNRPRELFYGKIVVGSSICRRKRVLLTAPTPNQRGSGRYRRLRRRCRRSPPSGPAIR